MKKFLKDAWAGLKPALLNWLEKASIKFILKKLAIAGGFKAWLITFVVGELIEEADEHLIEPAFRKVGFIIEVHEGKKTYAKLINAEDRDTWRDVVRDV